MTIARLDNSVFFKKAFTDKIVFKAFVNDILGIEINPDKIETEKSFEPKVGNINFKYDIFAEDVEQRIIVEIQKVEYDHNFDRFLHYHLQGITEQQRSSNNYSIGKTVYTIVVITAPFTINRKSGEFFRDEVLISKLNPKNLKGIERKIFNHELIFLNPNYRGDETPANYRDWLDLIYDSIHNPENPKLNFENKGVERASELLNFDTMDPYDWEKSKFEVMRNEVLLITAENEKIEVARRMIKKGYDNQIISEITDLEFKFIDMIRKDMENS